MQTEKPAPTAAELAATLGMDPAGVTMSGGLIENFRKGWAINAHHGNVAHYYRRNGFGRAVAKCGIQADVKWLYGEGNWPRCKRCQKA